MADLLGQLLAVGIGAAISPVATALCIALLGSSKPLENALAFTLVCGETFSFACVVLVLLDPVSQSLCGEAR
jgi:hypothetical protein